MKRSFIALLALLGTSVFGKPAPGIPTQEFRLPSIGAVLIGLGSGNLAIEGGLSSSMVGYGLTVHRNFQIVGNAGFNFLSTPSSSTTSITGALGPNFNFGGDNMDEDFFIGGSLGISVQIGSSSTTTTLNAVGLLGKRFWIADHICFNPSATINIPFYSTGVATLYPTLILTPISFSVLL